MVTKSQKVHISKDDELPNFAILTLLNVGSGFPRVAGIHPSQKKYLICPLIGLLFSDCSLFTK